MLSGNLFKKIYPRTPQHRYFATETQFRIYVHTCAQARKGRLFLEVLINNRGSLYNHVWLPVCYMLKSVKVNSAFSFFFLKTLNIGIPKSATEPQRGNICGAGEEDNSPENMPRAATQTEVKQNKYL